MHTHNTESPSGTSYEIICAAALKVPSVLYLLPELHPAMIIPITSNDTIAKRKNIPEVIPEPCHVDDRGITEKPANTVAKIRIGAARKSFRSAAVGTMSSF